jgi:hypothetical protein
MFSNRRPIRGLIFVCGVGVLSGSRAFGASLPSPTPTTFDARASSVTLTHIEDSGNESSSTFPVTVAGSQIPSASTPKFPLNHTFTASSNLGSSSTTAVAGIYEITSPTNLSVAVQAGSGITQANVPGKVFSGSSDTVIQIDAVWQIGSNGFPTAGHLPTLSYQFPLAGTVGLGGMDEFQVNLQFDSSVSEGAIGFIDTDKQFSNPSLTTKMPFTANINGIVLINDDQPLPAGSLLEMTGTIEFMATNDDSPSDFSLTDDGTIGAVDAATVPEPASLAMATVGAIGVLALRRRAILN